MNIEPRERLSPRDRRVSAFERCAKRLQRGLGFEDYRRALFGEDRSEPRELENIAEALLRSEKDGSTG